MNVPKKEVLDLMEHMAEELWIVSKGDIEKMAEYLGYKAKQLRVINPSPKEEDTTCPKCQGCKYLDVLDTLVCLTCKGTGKVDQPSEGYPNNEQGEWEDKNHDKLYTDQASEEEIARQKLRIWHKPSELVYGYKVKPEYKVKPITPSGPDTSSNSTDDETLDLILTDTRKNEPDTSLDDKLEALFEDDGIHCDFETFSYNIKQLIADRKKKARREELKKMYQEWGYGETHHPAEPVGDWTGCMDWEAWITMRYEALGGDPSELEREQE